MQCKTTHVHAWRKDGSHSATFDANSSFVALHNANTPDTGTQSPRGERRYRGAHATARCSTWHCAQRRHDASAAARARAFLLSETEFMSEDWFLLSIKNSLRSALHGDGPQLRFRRLPQARRLLPPAHQHGSAQRLAVAETRTPQQHTRRCQHRKFPSALQ
eukprot:COSAG04_NODE_5688_length_1525_cov_22.112685_2_plen_161_part_00